MIKKHPRLQRASIIGLKQFVAQSNLDCQLGVVDTVDMITSKELKKIPVGIFLNKFRLFTGSIHLYRYGKRDRNLAKKVATFLRKYFKSKNYNVSVEVPEAFGNIIFWPSTADKGKAFARIKKYYPGYDLAMIGDDKSDLKTLKHVKYLFAVGNALPIVKKRADYAAKAKYTQGVVEILQYIKKKGNI